MEDQSLSLSILELVPAACCCLLLAIATRLRGSVSAIILPTLLLFFHPFIGIDISESALKVALKNATKNNLCSRTGFVIGDFGTTFSKDVFGKPIDVLLSNPPYIGSFEMEELSPSVKDFEPSLALFGGNDGLHCYRQIALRVQEMLENEIMNHQTKVILEVGYQQSDSVSDIFMATGVVSDCKIHKDLSGVNRCVQVNLK